MLPEHEVEMIIESKSVRLSRHVPTDREKLVVAAVGEAGKRIAQRMGLPGDQADHIRHVVENAMESHVKADHAQSQEQLAELGRESIVRVAIMKERKEKGSLTVGRKAETQLEGLKALAHEAEANKALSRGERETFRLAAKRAKEIPLHSFLQKVFGDKEALEFRAALNGAYQQIDERTRGMWAEGKGERREGIDRG